MSCLPAAVNSPNWSSISCCKNRTGRNCNNRLSSAEKHAIIPLFPEIIRGAEQRFARLVGLVMKIYIAAPLFSEGERAFHEKVDAIVREYGHETFLPQREGGCVADLPDMIEGVPVRKYLFQLDCKHMDRCDAVLFLFDGRVPDEGACFELGYCYAKGKRCIGYKTDARSFIDGFDNVMLYGAPEVVLQNEDELRDYMKKISPVIY